MEDCVFTARNLHTNSSMFKGTKPEPMNGCNIICMRAGKYPSVWMHLYKVGRHAEFCKGPPIHTSPPVGASQMCRIACAFDPPHHNSRNDTW
jgi:hypothetical protein